ncbi:DUF3237 domain-containing protein [Ferrovibrio sp.]|uniref:DUF3237 domain-containing protein n=1 Tax=Ferrovibrio sp. TaxID=1917215 RepID=UPI003D14191B
MANAPILTLEIDLAAPQSIGQLPGGGERRCVPIIGGRFMGRVNGAVLAGGADWQWLRGDGVADIDARYLLQSEAGAGIEVWSRGLRHGPPGVMAQLAAGEPVDPALYYFRTSLRFESAAPELQWLVRMLAYGKGQRLANQVRLSVYAID